MQLNFLDADTSHLAPVEPVNVPTASDKARQKAEILQALEWAGEDGVTTLRMREICALSVSQRISDLRKEGHKIVCRAVANSNWYFLEEPNTTSPQENAR